MPIRWPRGTNSWPASVSHPSSATPDRPWRTPTDTAHGCSSSKRMAALETECDRLVALGATRVERREPEPLSPGHIVMTDPEGNEFCLD